MVSMMKMKLGPLMLLILSKSVVNIKKSYKDVTFHITFYPSISQHLHSIVEFTFTLIIYFKFAAFSTEWSDP